MVNYNISINNDLALIIDKQMSLGKYANRSEFFRDIIRSLFVKNEKEFEIESIMPGTKDYEEMSKLMKKKNEFVPFSQIEKELKLS